MHHALLIAPTTSETRFLMRHRPYLIYSRALKPEIGGDIALHALCQRLTELGEDASIWSWNRSASLLPSNRKWFRNGLGFIKNWLRYRHGLRLFDVKAARRRDLRSAIVVYPEVIYGNPLKSDHVVRWFLHRPGFHTKQTGYGPGEQYFFYQDAFDDPTINPEPENRLTVSWLNPLYRQTNFGPRSGTCYLLRKGAGRARDLDPAAPVLDGLPHEEIAAIFNRCEYLVSYDLYSMYSVFASLCGCTPVIVPEEGVSRGAWFADPEDRVGLAYGWEDVDHARATRNDLLHKLEAGRAREDEMVRSFIAKTQSKFPRADQDQPSRS